MSDFEYPERKVSQFKLLIKRIIEEIEDESLFDARWRSSTAFEASYDHIDYPIWEKVESTTLGYEVTMDGLTPSLDLIWIMNLRQLALPPRHKAKKMPLKE